LQKVTFSRGYLVKYDKIHIHLSSYTKTALLLASVSCAEQFVYYR
jgi:hypothetical protein